VYSILVIVNFVNDVAVSLYFCGRINI